MKRKNLILHELHFQDTRIQGLVGIGIFLSIIFWIANGLAYCILLFTSNECHRLIPTEEDSRWEISTFFRTNGSPPISAENQNLKESNFSTWSPKIDGLVERPVNLSLLDLRNMKKQLQVVA